MSKELNFQIASINFKYIFDYNCVLNECTPINKFLLKKTEKNFDVINKIYKIKNNEFDIFLNKRPVLVTPAWSKYIINNEKYYLFHPNDAGNIAFIKCLDNEYIFLETYVINMNYDIQPLPLCITGLLLQKKLCQLKRGLIMHGATLDIGGKGIVFTGNSGVGKSTLSNLCIKNISNVPIKRITDDRFILSIKDDKFYSYGNPLDSKIDNVNDLSVEINKIVFLHHGSENKISKINSSEVFIRLFKIALLPYGDKKYLNEMLTYFKKMVNKIEFYDFYFIPTETAPLYLNDNLLC